MGPFVLKLVWLSLASFFVVHLAAGLAVWGLAPAVMSAAARLRASSAARLLLVTRLFPCAFALFVVVAFCVPSYLWLEPEAASEEMSIPCLVAAILCTLIWMISITRAARTIVQSLRYLRSCRNSARELNLPGYEIAGLVTGDAHSIGLAGIFRPRVVIGRDILEKLSQEQLDAALRHEWAHAASRDNLKKLLLLLAPDVAPFLQKRFRAMDQAWARFAEWAADDRAAAGDPQRALFLADALVAVARTGGAAHTGHLMTSLVAQPGELSARVDRLVEIRPDRPKSPRRLPLIGAGIVFAALVVPLGAPMLTSVHELLEKWIR
jgi:Zn-dependent protease with chaperone function